MKRKRTWPLCVPHVSTVELQGFSEHQLRVEVPELTVRQYGIGVEEVARAIAQQSIEVPAGTLETRDRELLVRFADERVTPGQLAGVVVASFRCRCRIRCQFRHSCLSVLYLLLQ